MWLVTSIGFFSAVNNPRKSGEVMIRGRVEADLIALKKVIPEMSEITFTTHSDYSVRAFCSKEAWVKGLAKLGEEMDYTNFKTMIGKRQGHSRASIYMDVWIALKRLEKLCPRLQTALRAGFKGKGNKHLKAKWETFHDEGDVRSSDFTTDGSGFVVPVRKADAEEGASG
jgi:hypothetical protein